MPFTIKDCREHSVYWLATRLRVEALRDYFLKVTPTMPLLDAKGGDAPEERIKVGKLARGRRVFAKNCIVCHSSVQPETRADIWLPATHAGEYTNHFGGIIAERRNALDRWKTEFWDHDPGQWLRNPNYEEWATNAVEQPGFWQWNFLSMDYRIPVNYIGTNPGRALANNATAGHMWEDFSSDSYRHMPPVGSIAFFNPYSGSDGETNFFTPRHLVADGVPPTGGGPGFYRPATLMSVWATAPFLHNNSLGVFNNDPSVRGRMAAFTNAIHMLLSIEERVGNTNYASTEQLKKDHGLIWRTSSDTYLIIPAKHVPAFARRLSWPHSLDNFARWLEKFGGEKWVPSAGLLAIAFLLLVFSKGAHRWARWQRFSGYTAVFAALGVGFLIYFLAGGLGDLRIGPIPAGTPVNLLANINPEAPQAKLKAALRATADGLTQIQTRQLRGEEKAKIFHTEIAPALLEVSKCPDFVMDKGHHFPWFKDITPEDKEAIIELLKTF